MKERIAQFVMGTATGAGCVVSDIETDPEENKDQNKEGENADIARPDLEFCASTLGRTAFVKTFALVRRQALHKGFDML